MKEEEIVIRYRIPSIPVGTKPKEKEMMEEAHRNFGQQIIGLVMDHLKENGVELMEARKKDFVEIQMEKLRRSGSAGEVSVPMVFR